MPKVLVTGMSGTGKSAALRSLGERGHRVIGTDTDTDQWSRWVILQDGSPDWVWREDTIAALLASHRHGHLFVAGCKTNQGTITGSPASRKCHQTAELLREWTRIHLPPGPGTSQYGK